MQGSSTNGQAEKTFVGGGGGGRIAKREGRRGRNKEVGGWELESLYSLI